MDFHSSSDMETLGEGQEVLVPLRPGYSEQTVDNETYIVPNVLGQSHGLSLARVVKPNLTEALETPGGPGISTRLYSTPMGEDMIEARVDPGPSQRELHILHAEIEALQHTFGISYKDAAHRLFMAEVEQVKKASSAAKSFSGLRKRIGDLVAEEIYPPINAIDKGEFNKFIFKDGKWESQSDGQESG